MGNDHQMLPAWRAVNKAHLKAALHRRKGITLDIDATEIIAHKTDAQSPYPKVVLFSHYVTYQEQVVLMGVHPVVSAQSILIIRNRLSRYLKSFTTISWAMACRRLLFVTVVAVTNGSPSVTIVTSSCAVRDLAGLRERDVGCCQSAVSCIESLK
jgi:hypothetical protein